MKTLKISDEKKLKDIKQEFNAHFPHLKIEFFSEEHHEGEGNSRMAMYDDKLQLKDIRKIHNEGELSIDGHQKTSTFEKNFHSHFGVNVQVFRKQGRIWLQTILTDDWTLGQQEHKGEEYDN
ncbi:MAG TPA: hypothetical protein EYG85_11670 [Crocinitomix sp.]|nr:hypothetical protein [Crocinitomix sp.]